MPLNDPPKHGDGTTCKYCRKSGLHWVETTLGWHTCEPSGAFHRCKAGEDKELRRALEAEQSVEDVILKNHVQLGTDGRWEPNHLTKNEEEKETMENFAALHDYTKNYVALEVTFEPGGKSYFYKANSDLGILEGDHVVVLVSERAPADQLKIVAVKKVHTDPVSVLSPSMRYKWIVDKIDFSSPAWRLAWVDNFIAGMRQLEARKAAEAMVETFVKQYGPEAAGLLDCWKGWRNYEGRHSLGSGVDGLRHFAGATRPCGHDPRTVLSSYYGMRTSFS